MVFWFSTFIDGGYVKKRKGYQLQAPWRMGYRTNTVTLLNRDDTHTYNVGMPIVGTLIDGRFVAYTRWQLVKSKLRAVWERATRWFHPRTVVSEVDHECGTVTLRTQRWSWTKWRWL